MSHSDLTPDTTLSKKLKYIVITHGDSYLGQTLAMHIADQLDKGQGQLKKKHRAVRVLCQDKAKLKHLERRGIQVKVRPSLSKKRESLNLNCSFIMY